MKLFLISVLFCGLMTQCCCPKPQHTDQPYPRDVSGWRERSERGITIHGNFVLRKGETTDNGKIQVGLVDIIPPDPCAEVGTFQRQARARIQFIRVADQRVLCEDTYAERGGRDFSPDECQSSASDISALSELGVEALYVNAINLREKWVFFEIR